MRIGTHRELQQQFVQIEPAQQRPGGQSQFSDTLAHQMDATKFDALVGWMAGAPWGVACYVILLSLITAFAVWCGPETHDSDIDAETA